MLILKRDNKLFINEGWYYSIIMEYQKPANLLNDESSKSPKFRTKNWVEINKDVRCVYCSNKQIRFKKSMLKSSLCDYRDAYILLKEIYQLIILLLMVLLQIILIKK